MERMKNGIYWPGLKVSVTEFCQLCDSCAARKPSPKQDNAPMGHISSVTPMEKVCIHIFGSLLLTRQKHKYIFVITDVFTKRTEAIPLPDKEARTIITAFVDTFVSRFGTPLQVHSEQGRNFEAKFFQEMCTWRWWQYWRRWLPFQASDKHVKCTWCHKSQSWKGSKLSEAILWHTWQESPNETFGSWTVSVAPWSHSQGWSLSHTDK